MVLAVAYMKRTGQIDPELDARAREQIDVGYRRLVGFEVPGEPGGFDWWGKAPANLFLTAYALLEFHEMAEVYPVDPALLARIVAWLTAHQREDGSWSPEGVKTGWSTDMAKGRSFHLTAYVAWGLARAGAPSAKAIAYLTAHASEATDPYGLSLASLAFLATDKASPVGRSTIGRLVPTGVVDEHGLSFVPTGETGIGARGQSATIETTALAIQALLLDGREGRVAHRALDRLVRWRQADGRFGTTQSTILSLQALLAADAASGRRGDATVDVVLGHEPKRSVKLSSTSTEPVRLDVSGAPAGPLVVSTTGDGRTNVALTRTSWVPWITPRDERGRLALAVRWPEEVLAIGRPAKATVSIENRSKDAKASVVTLEIGIPPGCDVEREDVRGQGIANVERGETTVVIYLRDLDPAATATFTIGFRPRYAIDVVTAPSTAYEYYVPEEAVTVGPIRVRAAR